MSRCVELSPESVALRVFVGDDPAFFTSRLGGTWVYSAEPVGKGMTYDPIAQRFRPMQPFRSWTWNAILWQWEPPTPHPDPPPGLAKWRWNESTLEWVRVDVS